MASDPFGEAPGVEDDDLFSVDLPEEDDNFCIPEGPYEVECIDLEKGESAAGNPMWVWQFEVARGEEKGHELRVYTALTPAAMWKLRETLEALGLGQAGKASKFKRADAIGKRCTAYVVDDEYKGVKRSTVANLVPLGAVPQAEEESKEEKETDAA